MLEKGNLVTSEKSNKMSQNDFSRKVENLIFTLLKCRKEFIDFKDNYTIEDGDRKIKVNIELKECYDNGIKRKRISKTKLKMFTQNCFIRLSTPKLTDGLHKLGGRNGTGFWHSNVQTLLIAESDKYYCLKDECGNVDYLIKNGYIDCQINEDLFLALAALRNDSDIYQ